MLCQIAGCRRNASFRALFDHVAPLEVCSEHRGTWDGQARDVVPIAGSSRAEQLLAAVEKLEAAYEQAHARMVRDFADPLDVRDTAGRYVLLDALTAIVTARTALAGATP